MQRSQESLQFLDRLKTVRGRGGGGSFTMTAVLTTPLSVGSEGLLA